MTKLKSPLLSIGAKGTIAGSLTLQKRGIGTIARRKPIPTDPKSAAQLAWRQVYRDAVDAWHALTPEEKDAWRGVCPGLTAYQCFMRSELKKVAPPIPIDIGSPAIDRTSGYAAVDRTYINLENPANATGALGTIHLFPRLDMDGVRVGTFYLVSGTTYKCRDSTFIGSVPVGFHSFPGLSIAVGVGDYIGTYWTVGRLEADRALYAGVLYALGEHIDPGDETPYFLDPGNTMSLYGIGEGPA